jgi:hypothetical protein
MVETKMVAKIFGGALVAGILLGFSAPIAFASPEGPLKQACKDGGGTWNPADHTCIYPKK